MIMNRSNIGGGSVPWACAAAAIAILLATHAHAQDEDGEVPAHPAYTLAEVAEHDSRSSCWFAIEGRVYDVTGFIPEHPTPPGILLEWCGKDATQGWRTKGYGNTHSADAESKLGGLLIGVLAEAE